MATVSTGQTMPEHYLSPDERDRLGKLEKVIDQGLKTFYQVGLALAEIRTSRLYRERYQNWDEYCEKKWGMRKTTANRMIVSSQVMDNLTPIGVILPDNESQIRPLTKIKDPEKQIKIWEDVIRESEGRKVTAKMVAEAVKRELRPKAKATTPKPVPAPPAEPEPEPADTDMGDPELRTQEIEDAVIRLCELLDKEVKSGFATTSQQWIAEQIQGMVNLCGFLSD